ncbi:hypothetical protein [Pseudomonas graminis]|uniref:hypothetical protein n=1 Tax=Pseudomonas graminis TaxID=158627 RepID=UPI003C251104
MFDGFKLEMIELPEATLRVRYGGSGPSGSAEYKRWVHTFLFNGEVFNFDADDLWAARCGNIHTGAAESRDYRAHRASVIYYHVNTASIPNDKLLALIEPIAIHIGVPVEKIRFVDHYWLAGRFIDSVSRYEQYLLTADVRRLQEVQSKSDRQLSFQTVK